MRVGERMRERERESVACEVLVGGSDFQCLLLFLVVVVTRKVCWSGWCVAIDCSDCHRQSLHQKKVRERER